MRASSPTVLKNCVVGGDAHIAPFKPLTKKFFVFLKIFFIICVILCVIFRNIFILQIVNTFIICTFVVFRRTVQTFTAIIAKYRRRRNGFSAMRTKTFFIIKTFSANTAKLRVTVTLRTARTARFALALPSFRVRATLSVFLYANLKTLSTKSKTQLQQTALLWEGTCSKC